MSPLSNVRNPCVLVEGQAVFSSSWVWQAPAQQTAPAVSQMALQSTDFPQDFLFLIVPQRPAQIFAWDLR